MTDSRLIPAAHFRGLQEPFPGRGVIASACDGLGLATVLVRKGRARELGQRLPGLFGIELPRGPRYVASGDVAFAGTGPGAWLALRKNGGNAFAASLQEAIGDLASISDQSDGYAVLHLTGPKLPDTLAKLIPIDVHPRTFRPGDVASTVASHIGATLWRLEDDAGDGSPVFEVAVFSSLAVSFWHALSEAAAEFGLAMVVGRDSR
jgi:methylglutamate dehydrogenase subunit D